MIKCPFCGYKAGSLEDAVSHLIREHRDIVEGYALKKSGKSTPRSLRRAAFCLAQFGFRDENSCDQDA